MSADAMTRMTPNRRAALDLKVERARQRRQEIVEDVDWLHRGGVHPLWWPKRVGVVSVGAIEKTLRVEGRHDLAAVCTPYMERS